MAVWKISEDVFYVGVNDTTLDLFESQYRIPDGVTYNSYVIKDSKIAVMDTVDNRATDAWFDNLEEVFGGKAPDYLVVSHLEPDHAGNIRKFLVKYPETVVVANAKTVAMLPQFFELDTEELSILEVKEGDTLKLGRHTLHFVMAPMVHWPEVMVEYDEADKIYFQRTDLADSVHCHRVAHMMPQEKHRTYWSMSGQGKHEGILLILSASTVLMSRAF